MVDERRRTAHNKGFAIAGLPYFADTFVQGGLLLPTKNKLRLRNRNRL
jgi:hypothetical protein